MRSSVRIAAGSGRGVADGVGVAVGLVAGAALDVVVVGLGGAAWGRGDAEHAVATAAASRAIGVKRGCTVYFTRNCPDRLSAGTAAVGRAV